jgi:TRAP-type mannitol/chloroaromatic compound transport system substrate-binding protein
MNSNKALLVAVSVAFSCGLVGSLAIRPVDSAQTVQQMSSKDGELAQRINWRVPVSFSSAMPVLGEPPLYLRQQLDLVTRGAIRLQIFEPGEIVPAFSITDAVRDGKVEAGYTWLGYDQGKIPASALLAATPFGLEPWEYMGWWYEGGGAELARKLYEPHHIMPLFCGLIGPETAGWFRQPLQSLDDIQGLKIRFAGLGGKVFEQAGASVTMLPGGEIFQALEKGAIDATEYSLPIVDQSLGFARVAKNNYFPGWHQPFTASHLAINLDIWNGMQEQDQALLTTVCEAAVLRNLAASEGRQGAVIEGFPSMGVTARYLPMDILRELRRLSEMVMDEEAAKNADFDEILKSQRKFSAQYAHWKRLAYLPRDF